MNPTDKTAFVTRPTGTLGTAVTKLLLTNGYTIHALVPDHTTDRAKLYRSLSPASIKLFATTTHTLEQAVAGCTYLFLNLMPTYTDLAVEYRNGLETLSAAKKSGIKHVVYSSLLGLDTITSPAGMSRSPLFAQLAASKVNLEAAVKDSGFQTWTILRPGYFMSNFLAPFNDFMWPGLSSEGKAVSSYRPDSVLNLTSPHDIASFTLAAFSQRDRFHGQVIGVASQKLEVEKAIETLRRVIGKNIDSVYRSDEESEARKKEIPLIIAQLTQREMPIEVDWTQLRSWSIDLSTFESFLAQEKELVERTFAKFA